MTRDTVVFRAWKHNGEVIALFPAEIVDDEGHCNSYEHIGQHGGADYRLVVRATRPATPKEYGPLVEELQRIGYDLKIRKRG